MVRKKSGWPEEGELVIATVTKIQFHSVFCNLDEYDKSGMIHISEIAPGRIRNITEYVREGKTVVVKVLRLDKDKGHIDLSLRRVTEAQRRNKASHIKQEQVVEKVLTTLSETTKKSTDELHEQLQKHLLNDYDTLFEAFQAIVENQLILSKTKLDKQLITAVEKAVRDRIKPQAVAIKGVFTITSYAGDGVQQINAVLGKAPEHIDVSYAGGGRYTTIVHDKDFKSAEEHLKAFITHVQEGLKDAEVAFERTDR